VISDTPGPPSAYRLQPAAPAAARPFEAAEIRAAALVPHRVIDLVLVDRARLVKTVAAGRHLPALLLIMLLWSALFALPYGAVLGADRAWRIPALYLGSTAICFPSLHVFASYLGCKRPPAQNLVIALLIGFVASSFTLSFAPILWFIDLTTAASSIAVATVSMALLAASLLAGLWHLGRALLDEDMPVQGRRYRASIFAWQALLVFVSYRMAVFLGLA
jgi:hypothetical protein